MQTVNFDVLVVGAGPAGLVAGIAWARAGFTVCVLERNFAAGRKMLLSGSGQCNVTHKGSSDDFLLHYGGQKKINFVKPCYLAFDNAAVIKFFECRGVPLFEREDGKIFPKSLNAEDLLTVLIEELSHYDGNLQTNTFVQRIRKLPVGFEAETDRGIFCSQKLIIATGGQSYPATGSQGDGFRFAAELGHRIVSPKPALTPIIVKKYPFQNCAGISFTDVPLTLLRNGSVIKKGSGDLLFTHCGLSGPAILNMSRHIEPEDTIKIQIIPPENLGGDLYTGKKMLKNALYSLKIPERFLLQLLKMLQVDPDLPAAETNREIQHKIIQALTGLTLLVERLGDWNQAMITSGGVSLKEVHRQTMESRLVSGLYFCGEVLDIDGDSGGYNIQFAISSGWATAYEQQSIDCNSSQKGIE